MNHLPSIAALGLVGEFSKGNRVFNCHQCDRSYQMRHNLVKHLRFECGGQKHFACLLCPSRYTQNGKLRQHMLNTHNIFAEYLYLRITRFARLPRSPTGLHKTQASTKYSGNSEDQALQCSACGKRYSLKHNLARHVRFECGGQRKFSCHLCPNKYTQNVSLRRHLTHHHNVVMPVKKRYNGPRKMYDRSTKSFSCPKCKRAYTLQCNLGRHMRLECGGKRNFRCRLCHKRFTQKTSLTRHLSKIHTNQHHHWDNAFMF
ncbi:hypothetical protein ACFW04_005954 [Cataglyphis niger]